MCVGGGMGWGARSLVFKSHLHYTSAVQSLATLLPLWASILSSLKLGTKIMSSSQTWVRITWGFCRSRIHSHESGSWCRGMLISVRHHCYWDSTSCPERPRKVRMMRSQGNRIIICNCLYIKLSPPMQCQVNDTIKMPAWVSKILDG